MVMMGVVNMKEIHIQETYSVLRGRNRVSVNTGDVQCVEGQEQGKCEYRRRPVCGGAGTG